MPGSSTRCSKCQKIVTLAGTFTCACKKIFCSSHRFSDQHECRSVEEIKEKDLQNLKDQLVQCVASKIEKI